MNNSVQEFESPAFDVECNLGFLDEVDNVENPMDFSAEQTSSTKSHSSNSEKSPDGMKANGKQMVMID